MKIPITRTSFTEEETQSVLEPLRRGWLVQGVKVIEFEEKWSAFTGAKYSIAVTSCTTALHLSLAALGFGPGDEAIVPAFTWISTANIVEHLGGKVVFCDIDLDTFNLQVNQIEQKITPRTKVILPVHLFGLPVDMKPIKEIAKRYNIWVVEDAACGFGTRYYGQHVGVLGETGCFSFHPRKAITTGEGGMITTKDYMLSEKLRRLRDHGAVTTDLYRHKSNRPHQLVDHLEAGYNQRMTDIQAALGSAQMDRAIQIVTERQRLASVYNEAFSSLSWLKTPVDIEGFEHGYQSYPCLFQTEPLSVESILRVNHARNMWMDHLYQKGISTRPATHAVHMLSYYKEKYKLQPENFPNAYIANNCSISLPIFQGLSEEEQAYVIEQVVESKF